jgi:hypothetical protein
MRPVDLIVMNGQVGESEAERMVGGARAAITQDLVDKAIEAGTFRSIIVSTNDRTLADVLTGLPTVVVEMDPPGEPFHFGRRLQALIASHELDRVVYLGGGSAPLLPASTLGEMAHELERRDRFLLANNYYSVDFCAFTPASALLAVDPPVNDNRLGWLLCREAGLPAKEMARTTATVFDVDTPVDLLTLSLHPDAPPHIRAYLSGLELDTSHVEAASRVFVTPGSEALVAGRVSGKSMVYLGRETLCRTRVFSEERGMRADGRLERGEARSLLGMMMENVGMDRFFQQVIPQLGKAVFLDDRVLWAHHGVWPATSDRYNSDLYRPQAISDPFVRQFTESAMACPVPVVLGGHSLVTGGLYVLVEVAWERSGLNIQPAVEFA